MNDLLPNLRWLCLPSENQGQDWFEMSRQIDEMLSGLGMDLSEESVFLLFSNEPSEILEGNGECLIARPVIGPKTHVESPLKLIDWKAAPVWLESLQGETFIEILESAEEARVKANQGQNRFAKPFSLRVRRQLNPGLILSVDCIFHE